MLALKAVMPATRRGELASEFAQAGGLSKSKAKDQALENQDETTARAVRIFQERCDARAVLASNGLLDFHEAVDELQAAAVAAGLVAEIGQDAVQGMMAEAFRR